MPLPRPEHAPTATSVETTGTGEDEATDQSIAQSVPTQGGQRCFESASSCFLSWLLRRPERSALGVKVVMISDTHGSHRKLTVPDGDVLIHAGCASIRTSHAVSFGM